MNTGELKPFPPMIVCFRPIWRAWVLMPTAASINVSTAITSGLASLTLVS